MIHVNEPFYYLYLRLHTLPPKPSRQNSPPCFFSEVLTIRSTYSFESVSTLPIKNAPVNNQCPVVCY